MLNKIRLCLSALCLFVLLFGSSCLNYEKALYFKDLESGSMRTTNIAPEPVIQPNDILSVVVSSLNPQASEIYNQPYVNAGINAQNPTGSLIQGVGYLVKTDGTIQLPGLGNIKASGLTIDAFEKAVMGEFERRELLVQPIVIVRYLNFRVTVLGEVGHPTVITVPNDKISILEAIGLAGDLTIYARRDNILLIREENNQKIHVRLDIGSKAIFNSKYYYLKSGDVIYVEPGKAKVASAGRSQQILPIILSSVTLVAIIADRIFK